MTRHIGTALVLLIGLSAPGAARFPEEVLDFEDLAPKCVAASAEGDFGSGPVLVRGSSKRFGERVNAAVVVDTAHPEADADLATLKHHNALIVSRIRPTKPSGPEAAWAAGSVEAIDDEPIPGGVLSFDFSEIGPVTFFGLTLLDHDDNPASVRIFRTPGAGELLGSTAPGTRLDLTWGPRRWLSFNWFSPVRRLARLTLPSREQPFHRLEIAPIPISGRATGIDVRKLRARGRETRSAIGRAPRLTAGIPDVSRIEVQLGGSSAVDDVVFQRQGSGPPPPDEDLFSTIQGYLTREIEPRVAALRSSFFLTVEELVERRPPTLRSDLDRLIVKLERDLLGAPDKDDLRAGGLLQCPDLECGCPQLRALQAWVLARVERIRAQLAASAEAGATAVAAAPGAGPLLAAAEPAVHVAAALSEGRVELAQTGGGGDCAGTFWEQFFCEGRVLLAGVSSTIASLVPPKVSFGPAEVTLAGTTVSCDAFRLAPKSREFSHVETGILPGTDRRIPRGLYCVFCRTAGETLPWATLDLVANPDARPSPTGDEAERCAPTG